MAGRTRRVVVTIAATAVVLYLGWAIWDREALMQWMERARVVPFFVAMAILPALGVPSTPFYLLAGATFRIEVALIGTALAIAASQSIGYWIGRSGLRPRLYRLFERFDFELPDFDARAGAVRFTALFKLAPGVPGFIKNFGLGAARVPFAVFFTLGLSISWVYASALIVLGDSLFEHQLGPGTIAVLVAVGLAVVAWVIARRGRAQGDGSGAPPHTVRQSVPQS